MRKVLIICGPTATGKTSTAFYLAKRFKGELVSADSRQVYKGMDIGTGKEIDPEIKTWLIDLVPPKYQFNVADWVKQARLAINDILKRGKLPIVVGGTGFYLKALIEGVETIGIKPDLKLRERLVKLSVRQLRQKLPEAVLAKMNESDGNNPRRLIRKIELQGKRVKKNDLSNADYLVIGLRAPLPEIYEKIDARVVKRLKDGLLGEIEDLLKSGVKWADPGMNTLAYKEFRSFFQEKENLETAVNHWRFDEHKYARRQLTWFKKVKNVIWLDDFDRTRIEKLITKWYIEK